MVVGKIEFPSPGKGSQRPRVWHTTDPRLDLVIQWLSLISEHLNLITREMDALMTDSEGRCGLSSDELAILPTTLDELHEWRKENPRDR